MQHRIRIGDGQPVPQVEAYVIWVHGEHFRFASVKPPDFNSMLVVMLTDLLPDELACLRIGRIIIVHRDWPFRTVVLEAHERRKSTFGAYKQATLLHHGKVVTEGIDTGPDGDHQLDAHLL